MRVLISLFRLISCSLRSFVLDLWNCLLIRFLCFMMVIISSGKSALLFGIVSREAVVIISVISWILVSSSSGDAKFLFISSLWLTISLNLIQSALA